MASTELSRRVEKLVGYPPLSEMSDDQRRDFHESLLDGDSFEDLPGKWQAAIVAAEQNRPGLRLVSDPLVLFERSLVRSPTASRASARVGRAAPQPVHGRPGPLLNVAFKRLR